MSEQQALNATFFAFRKREKGGVLLGATVAYGVLTIALGALFWFLNQHAFTDYMNWITSFATANKSGAAPSPEAMLPPASVMSLGGAYFLFSLLYYILFAAYEAACLRWMVRSETGGVLGLSLGADTWRVYFGYWLWFFLLMAVYIVFIMIIFGFGAGAALSAQGKSDATAVGPMVGAALLLGFLALLAMIYFAVRLAPAAATSIACKRFAFFDAWKVTRGRFWALLGSFALVILMFVVLYLVMGIGAGIVIGVNAAGSAASLGSRPDPSQMLAMLTAPQVAVPLLIMYGVIIVSAFVVMVAMFGINARAAQAALEEGKIQATA